MQDRNDQTLPPELAVLSVAQMYAADKAATKLGIRGLNLMETAGSAIAATIMARWPRRAVTVLCGPGYNGGDGYVVARLLREAGWPVRIAQLPAQLTGDAALSAVRWQQIGGEVVPLTLGALDDAALVVDALFGAGLKRPLMPEVRAIVRHINENDLPCVAVDVPSGVLGDSGEIAGGGEDGAPRCAATVSFFRPKPAHLLYPGRALCGALTVADIGIPSHVLKEIQPRTVHNMSTLWRLPMPGWADHKYTRGHAVVVGGANITGASRLAARAARRAGAGLLTLAVPERAATIYAMSEPGCFIQPRSESDLSAVLEDPRRNGVLIGPGCGVGAATRTMVEQILATDRAVVLDADALTSFAHNPELLFGLLPSRRAETVLTPHAGEFERLFGDGQGGKLARTRDAAARSQATVVFKGADTVVAMPDGRAGIATNAPPWLATGGSGDVLAGLVLGLLVQGCGAWTAATAGVWLQGAAATAAGRGMVAEDLPDILPQVLAGL